MAAVPSKVDEITSVLRTEILNHQYRAGERLPSERDLSARFEANRGAVREALKKLEQLGIAEVTPGGVRVQPLEAASLPVLGHLLEVGDGAQQQTLMSQMIDVMGAMMSLSVRSAVILAEEHELERLISILDELVASATAGDEPSHQQHWMALNEEMMTIHQNLVLRLVGNGLRTQFMSKVSDSDQKPDLDRQALLNQLCAIRTAVVNQDHQAAAEAVIRHFNIISDGIRRMTADNAAPRSASHV